MATGVCKKKEGQAEQPAPLFLVLSVRRLATILPPEETAHTQAQGYHDDEYYPPGDTATAVTLVRLFCWLHGGCR